MVLSHDEIMNAIRNIVGDRTDDEAIMLIENVSDTFDNFNNVEDWKTKYEENDKFWREKYRNRFFNSASEEKDEEFEDKIDDMKSDKFEDLFEEKKED